MAEEKTTKKATKAAKETVTKSNSKKTTQKEIKTALKKYAKPVSKKSVPAKKKQQENKVKSGTSLNTFGYLFILALFVVSVVTGVFALGYHHFETQDMVDDLETRLNDSEIRYDTLSKQHNDLTAQLSPVLEQLGPRPEPEVNNPPRPDSANEAWLGSPDADYVMIKYTDAECPFCGSVHPTLKQIQSENSDNVALVYRHYPLENLHPNAEEYAVNLECVRNVAGNDAFWQMMGEVYDGKVTLDNFGSEVTQVGMTSADLSSCRESYVAQNTRAQIQENIQLLGSAQVGTPTTVLYNMKTEETQTVVGAQPYEQFNAVVKEFIR
jgi:protein-disulfide isomerase